jgi:hypothetical protein
MKSVSLLRHPPVDIERRSGRLGRTVSLVAVLAVLVASCGSASQTSAARTSAGQVALAFARDLFSGRLNQAASLVLPGEGSGFNVLATIIKHNVTRQTSLAIGSITMKGSTADVELTGTICSGPTEQALNCVTNSDPHSAQPAFREWVQRNGTRWYIYFPG